MRHEGFSAFPYTCPAGWLTVGFGHAIRKGEDFSRGVSRAQAETLLESDVMNSCAAVSRLIVVALSQSQIDALVSFTFNLGSGRLQSSTLRMKLNRGEYEAAARQFSRWVYGGGRKLPGLVARRAEERLLFEEG